MPFCLNLQNLHPHSINVVHDLVLCIKMCRKLATLKPEDLAAEPEAASQCDAFTDSPRLVKNERLKRGEEIDLLLLVICVEVALKI